MYYKNHLADHESEFPYTTYTPTTEDIHFVEAMFSLETVELACKHVNSKKATGDMIPAIALKHLPHNAIQLLSRVFINSYLQAAVPEMWHHSSIDD